MTVAELIEHLRTQPQDMRVCVRGYEGGYSDTAADKIGIAEVRLNENTDWYYGVHAGRWECDDCDNDNADWCNVLVIGRS
jgi:hypothetical protein